jgi:hypothetical protein
LGEGGLGYLGGGGSGGYYGGGGTSGSGAAGSSFWVVSATNTSMSEAGDLPVTPPSVTITYPAYTIAAFGQPINDPTSSTNPMSGSTVAVKFQVTDPNGNPLDDTSASAIAANCRATIDVQYLSPVTAPVDETINSSTANSGNCFRYDTTSHQFVFNLGTKAKGLSTGTYTITANVTGSYATTHSVNVGLR